MRILSLDIGDIWVGAAISDEAGITSRPYKTIRLVELHAFLEKTIMQEIITTIIVGYPLTLQGKESNQTKKVRTCKENLEKNFPTITWILWDERLSSKRAKLLQRKKRKTPQEKEKEHALAASFILQGYLDHLAMKRTYV